MNPKLSIIMPVCNVEKYLSACLESALNQSFDDIEIICINDGSTDNSLAILKEFSAKDNRIVIVDKANAGYGAAMNDGLKIAKGEYIGILESDDRVCEDAWKRLFETAIDNDLDLIRGNYIQSRNDSEHFFEANRIMERTYPDDLPEAPYDIVFKPTDYPRCFWTNPSIWTGLFKTQFLRDNDIWFNETPGAAYQDTAFAFKTWAMANRAMLVEYPVIYYTVDNESSSSNSKSKAYAVCDEIHEIENYLSDRKVETICHKALSAVRYKTYAWNKNRISDDLKGEFEQLMWDEMRSDNQNGYCDEQVFRRNAFEIVTRNINDLPTVSIVVCIKNETAFLQRCLDSVLGQTLQDIEVICVAYGDCDDCLKTLENYKQNDDRVSVIVSKDSNTGEAFNKGLSQAKGTYLLFLNPSDSIDPGMLEDLSQMQDKNDLDIAMCKMRVYNSENGNTLNLRNAILGKLKQNKLYDATDLWGYAFRYADGSTRNKLLRRSYIANLGLDFQDTEYFYTDYLVYMALALEKRFMFTNKRYAIKESKKNVTSSAIQDMGWQDMFLAIDSIHTRLLEAGIYEYSEKDFVNWVARSLVKYLKSSKYEDKIFFEKAKLTYIEGLVAYGIDYFYKSDIYQYLEIWNSQDYESAHKSFTILQKSNDDSKKSSKAKKPQHAGFLSKLKNIIK